MRNLGPLTLVESPAALAKATEWFEPTERVHGRVLSLLPSRFETYVRIFHPALRSLSDSRLSETDASTYVGTGGATWREVRWAEVAKANGRVAHPGMQWPSLVNLDSDHDMQDGLWELAPLQSSLPLRLTQVLSEHLTAATTTPNVCWCCVWEGYSDLIGLRFDSGLPRVELPNRSMIVGCGPISAVPGASLTDGRDRPENHGLAWNLLGNYRSPSLWWPDDHAWCVATDVDMDTTYVGAARECAASLLRDHRVEAAPVAASDSIRLESDDLNQRESDP